MADKRLSIDEEFHDPNMSDMDLIYRLIEIKDDEFVYSEDLAKYLEITHQQLLELVALRYWKYPTEDVDRNRPVDACSVLFVVCRVMLDRMQ